MCARRFRSEAVIAKHPLSGFTLIELLIALAILAIVAGIAMPIYSTYTDRANRGEAQGDLMLCAQGMERWARSRCAD